MKYTREFRAIVLPGGKLPIDISNEIKSLLDYLSGKDVVIGIKLFTKRRSNKQNRYYWSVVVRTICQMMQDAGNEMDEDETHDFLREEVGKLKMAIIDPSGEPYFKLRSTTDLTTKEFEDYLEKIRAFAARFGYAIPMPQEELYRENNYDGSGHP